MQTLFWELLWRNGHHVGLFKESVEHLWGRARSPSQFQDLCNPEGQLLFGFAPVLRIEPLHVGRTSEETYHLVRTGSHHQRGSSNLWRILSCAEDPEKLGWLVVEAAEKGYHLPSVSRRMAQAVLQEEQVVAFQVARMILPQVVQRALSIAGVLKTSRPP